MSRRSNEFSGLGIQALEPREMMYGGDALDNSPSFADRFDLSGVAQVGEMAKPEIVAIGDLYHDSWSAEPAAAKIFLDFGLGFAESNGPNGEDGHYFDLGWIPEWVDQANGVFSGENPYNGETVFMPDTRGPFGGFEYLNSIEDNLEKFDFDYDNSGSVGLMDADSLAEHVADAVRRSYEPFDVEVVIVQSNSWDDMLQTLASNEGHDSYVILGGNRFGNGVLGHAPLDEANERDDIVFAYADDIFSRIEDTNDLHDLVTALGKAAAHEAAHSFGLQHLAAPNIAQNDLMNVEYGLTKLTNETFATRGIEMLDEKGHYVDPYQYLADTLGLKEGGPDYVTGTSLNDLIKLTETVWGDVNVQIEAYREDGTLAESIQYSIDAADGVLIEAGIGDDTIYVDGDFDVIVRGGRGDDEITTGGGNDVLEGEAGKDRLYAGHGNDTYVWGGGVLDLGLDFVGDGGGNDTFDFSEFRGPIDIDMSQGGYQVVGSPSDGQPQLVIFNYSANSIENIYGTKFADDITGTAGDDKIVGNGGGDAIDGNGGNDAIFYLYEFSSMNLFAQERTTREKALEKSDKTEKLKEATAREVVSKEQAGDDYFTSLGRTPRLVVR